MNDLGITHIITVMECKQNLPQFVEEERRLHISISDTPQENILQHLDTTTAFIKKALEDEANKVLVRIRVEG